MRRERPDSVATGRTLDEIAAEQRPRLAVERARQGRRSAAGGRASRRGEGEADEREDGDGRRRPRAEAPALPSLVPQLRHAGRRAARRATTGCTRSSSTATASWRAYERRGARCSAATARTGRERFPRGRARARRAARRTALLDGEVVVLRRERHAPSFQALQNALSRGDARAAWSTSSFDLLHLDGYDLAALPLERAQGALARAAAPEPAGGRACATATTSSGTAASSSSRPAGSARRHHLQARATRPTQRARPRLAQGQVHRRAQEFVIGGFTEPEGARAGFGALLLGVLRGRPAAPTRARSAPASTRAGSRRSA